jgi:hypothetical protein
MKAVLVLELRGLTQQAEVLVHELEHMSMNTERIRAATIDITKGAITRVSAAQHPEASGQQGTDTFYWTFPDVDSGAIFGSLLIADLWDKASRQGLYYVKPSLGLGWCEPQVSDSHLLDDGSSRPTGLLTEAERSRCISWPTRSPRPPIPSSAPKRKRARLT